MAERPLTRDEVAAEYGVSAHAVKKAVQRGQPAYIKARRAATGSARTTS